MAIAKKLPSGSWRVLAYSGKDAQGKRRYKSFTDPDKKKAEYAAAEYALKRKRENSAENLTFKTASDRYIEDKSNLLSPSTIRGYRIMQRNAFSLLLNKKLGKLETSDLIQKQMNENAKKYSAKSIVNQYGFITAVLGYFKFRIDSVTLKPPEDHTLPVPTKNDALRIMSLLQTAPDIECQALLALTCSLRQSEIAALSTDRVSGSQIQIHGACVPNEKNKLVYKETNKSKAGTRSETMPDYLTERLAERCKQVGEGPLFTLKPGQVLYRFKKLLKANGMLPYTIHSLRHCFAAIMHARGVPDKYVMEMGGWSSEYVMKKVYAYTFEDETRKAQKKANRYFDKTLRQNNATRNATRKENT